MTSRSRFTERRARRRIEAAERQEARNARTVEAQLELIGRRRGESRRELARLEAQRCRG